MPDEELDPIPQIDDPVESSPDTTIPAETPESTEPESSAPQLISFRGGQYTPTELEEIFSRYEHELTAARARQPGSAQPEPPRPASEQDEDPAWKRYREIIDGSLDSRFKPLSERIQAIERRYEQQEDHQHGQQVRTYAAGLCQEIARFKPALKDDPDATKQIVSAVMRDLDRTLAQNPRARPDPATIRQRFDEYLEIETAARARVQARAAQAAQGRAGAAIPGVKGGSSPKPDAKTNDQTGDMETERQALIKAHHKFFGK